MLNEIVQTYPTANSTKRKQVNELILEITEILHEEAKGNRGKIIGSS